MSEKTENRRYEKQDLDRAVEVLQQGGIILYPTDTVWGIGCDARNAEAVGKIFRLKQREDSKAMLCLLDAPGKLQGYVSVPEMAWDLLEAVAPEEGEKPQKPLTIIYPGAKNVAENLIAEDGSLGIRISSEPFTQALCQRLHGPLVSTSANVSGQPAAKCYREISEEIKQGVDYVCEYRRDDERRFEPSSIIKLGENNEVQVIRE